LLHDFPQQNNIRNLSLSQLENYFAEIDEKKFGQNRYMNGSGKNMPAALMT
jgi:hypothetical protein